MYLQSNVYSYDKLSIRIPENISMITNYRFGKSFQLKRVCRVFVKAAYLECTHFIREFSFIVYIYLYYGIAINILVGSNCKYFW